MHKISEEFVVRWEETDPVPVPATVDTLCPYCALPMAFVLSHWSDVPGTKARVCTASCSNCGGVVSFYWIPEVAPRPDGTVAGPSEDEVPRALYMHPPPAFIRAPLTGVSKINEFDVGLRRAYAATVNVYNSREWTGTSVVCRRTLEDIAKALLPEDRHSLSLGLKIQALSKRKDLAEPILKLADLLKRSGGLSAYFDLEKIPGQEAATYIIELLDLLIEYLFILPGRIQELHDKIESLEDEVVANPDPPRYRS